MQKISRIYLGGCGYTGAWFDGLTFDLIDPETDQPGDFILNLENGGGKTSLLSLIFSCFETSQDRFLKHLQSKNNHFTQYFSPDGQPGVILVEWLMPPRSAGAAPYRLVVGQVVSVKAGNDSLDSDRMFFSFETRDGLAFEDIPAPKISEQPAASMAEFSRWAHEQQKKYPGDVYITRKQADWQRHLRDERLIDLEMLQMQVNFSAQEGAFDTGFLNFTTELEFLRKFFHLTLDHARASAVRDAVATTCDKLRRKPTIQRRLTELTKFQGSLQDFADAAGKYQQATAEQIGVLVEGARMVQALQLRAGERQAEQKRQSTYEQDQRSIAVTATHEATSHSNDELTLTSLSHVRAVNASRQAKTAAEGVEREAEAKVFHVRAARVRAELLAAQTRVGELETLAGLANEGLQPFREQVEMQGALLRMGLSHEERDLRARVNKIIEDGREREAQVRQHRSDIAQVDRDQRVATQEQATLNAAEAGYERARARILEEELLASNEEATSDAMARWTNLEAQLRSEKSTFVLEQARLEKVAKEWRERVVAESNAVGRLDEQMREQNAFIGEATAERERLSQLPAILNAVEADVAEPDSLALPPLLEQVVHASAREVSHCDVRLAELSAMKQAIDETGVASNSPDVTLVVAQLRQAGIKSARPFNEYIADAVGAADQARALVLSDPARFSGVCVAESDLVKVHGLIWSGRKPARPVVVSPAALDVTRADESCIVFGPANDAAFNREAAATLLAGLTDRLAEEQKRRKTFSDRQAEALTALEALRAYLLRFGAAKLANARVVLARLLQDREHALARKEEAGEKADEAGEGARLCGVEAQDRETRAAEAGRHAKSLWTFKVEHEDSREARLIRQKELVDIHEELDARKAALQTKVEELEGTTRTEYKASAQMDAKADSLGRERGALKYYNKHIDAAALLKAGSYELNALRGTYQDALAAYEAEESTRLGVVRTQLEAARGDVTKKTEEFTRDYAGVTLSQVKPYEGMDHTAMLPQLQAAIQAASAARSSADAAFVTMQTLSSQWHSGHKSFPAPTPDMEALSSAELDERRVQAGALSAQASERLKRATEEADKARVRARMLGDQAGDDEKLSLLVRTSLSLEAGADPVLLALELASLAGTEAPDPSTYAALVLEVDAASQATRLVASFTNKVGSQSKARQKAQASFDNLRTAASDKELQAVEPELCAKMMTNEFSAACADAGRLLEGLQERIDITQDSLDKMKADFDACVDEVLNLARTGVSSLTTAATKRVPPGAPYVGGKTVLKMRANVSTVTVDARRLAIQHYLDQLIDTAVIPAKGGDLVADVVLRMYGGRPLGLHILKMVPDESLQYVAMDRIANSGGEGVVMAMFLYVVIAQLRAETQAKLHKGGGGPLLLDNPFAKASMGAMWKAQRLLASAMNIQLIFTTAIQDYNALGEFSNFKRIRKAGHSSKTGRTHLEVAKYKLNELPEAA